MDTDENYVNSIFIDGKTLWTEDLAKRKKTPVAVVYCNRWIVLVSLLWSNPILLYG